MRVRQRRLPVSYLRAKRLRTGTSPPDSSVNPAGPWPGISRRFHAASPQAAAVTGRPQQTTNLCGSRMTTLNPPEPQAVRAQAEATAPPAWRDVRLPGWRPWHGSARARDRLCLTAIAVSAIYAVAMIPLTPMLIATHPVLLEMLAGSNASVVAAGAFSDVNNLQPAIIVAAALPAMMRSDWLMWWAGRLWGHRFVERLGRHSPRAAARACLAERRGSRFAAPLVAASAFLPGGTQAPLYA